MRPRRVRPQAGARNTFKRFLEVLGGFGVVLCAFKNDLKAFLRISEGFWEDSRILTGI